MNILLDECVTARMRRELADHDVKTVSQMGWNKTKNGALLRLAQTEFDVFITVDRNMEYQQNLPALDLAVIVLVSRDIRWAALQPLMPKVHEVLQTVRKGEVVHVRP